MGWNKVYILIMGSIRSFDGRNCEWLIKYTPRGGHIARFANPWAPRGHLVTPVATLLPPRGVWFVWFVFRGHTVASV